MWWTVRFILQTVHQFLHDAIAGGLHLALEFAAAAGELRGELAVDGCQHEGNFIFGDDLAVDFGGDAIDLDGPRGHARALRRRRRGGLLCEGRGGRGGGLLGTEGAGQH